MRNFFNSKNTHIIANNEIIKAFQTINLTEHIINTGSKKIDTVLAGGFKPSNCYVIFGPNSSGKTQFCHHLCVQAYLKDIQTVFLDTENTFRPERIRELAIEREREPDLILKSILVSKIMSNNALIMKLNEINELIKNSQIKLLIIDSINNYFRLERGDKHISYFKAKTNFIKILEKLTELTQSFQLITIITAQVTSLISDSSVIKHLPVGLQYLSHFFSEFLYISPEFDSKGYLHLINSLSLTEKKVLFNITKAGIEDFKI